MGYLGVPPAQSAALGDERADVDVLTRRMAASASYSSKPWRGGWTTSQRSLSL